MAKQSPRTSPDIHCDRETIFALSSGQGRAAVAVIRISGPDSRLAITRLTRRDLTQPRRASVRSLYSEAAGVLDHALVLWLPGPHTVTGEDVAELHVHGGTAVLNGVLAELSLIPNYRVAEPGEFTRRAFEHGKADLTQVEALADLIDAETEGQRAQALSQMSGRLSGVYSEWREELIRALTLIEAVIDFSDEDVPDNVALGALPVLQGLAARLWDHLNDGRRGEVTRDGLSVVILGPPNSGKSTLLNVLAGRDAAIVSHLPGTTRDLVEVSLNLDGRLVCLVDTAGLRVTEDSIEQEGIRRALERASQADVTVFVFGRDAMPAAHPIGPAPGLADLVVLNKCDLRDAPSWPDWFEAWRGAATVVSLSARDGTNIEALVTHLARLAKERTGQGEAPAISRVRHRRAVESALIHVKAACGHLPGALDLAAEELRLAVRAFGRLLGSVDSEEVLGEIFKGFCIGK